MACSHHFHGVSVEIAPAGIGLFSTKTVEARSAVGNYLRYEAGFDPKIREIATRVMTETGAKGPQDMKVVMPKVIAETKGRADGKVVSGLVAALLKERAS